MMKEYAEGAENPEMEEFKKGACLKIRKMAHKKRRGHKPGALYYALCKKKNLCIQIAFDSPINYFRANVEDFY